MTKLVDIEFYSLSEIDKEKQEYNFKAKGYLKIENDETIVYFKYINKYKFIIKKELLKVYVNNSYYEFSLKDKTQALITQDNYSIKSMIVTNKLNWLDNLLELEYLLDFADFRGQYKITLKLL